MKSLQVILFFSFLLLALPSLTVESSTLNDTLISINITRGSSVSTYLNDSSYWLSPSGNIAFGFYQLPWSPAKYVVGIWFVKSPFKTLVWTANPPFNEPSSILLNNDGKLVLRTTADDKEKPFIPNLQEPVSYAMMHDDGNLVLYGSHSQVIWESFDYPTDTILGGQKLRLGVDLISGNHRLSVQQTNGLVAIYGKTKFDVRDDKRGDGTEFVISHALKGSVSTPVTLTLDITGNLYLVGSDGGVLKYIYRNKNRKPRKQGEGSVVVEEDVHRYRATLESGGNHPLEFGGHLNLYKERIDGNISHHEKSSSILVKRWPKKPMNENLEIFVQALITIGYIFAGVLGLLIVIFVLNLMYHLIKLICTCCCKA